MGRTTPFDFLYIAATIALTAYGQLVLKWRLQQLPPFPSEAGPAVRNMLWLLVDPPIFSGLLAAFLASLVWMAALKRFDLGFAYPFMSLNFAVVLVLNWWLFGEPLSAQRMLGVALIVAGTAFAARG